MSYTPCPEVITQLNPKDVFVFGSNASGFHGAGAAGLAFRGTATNTWRQDSHFLLAMKSPVGDSARIGNWAVFGVARGYQAGRMGASYAIETIRRAGDKRSVPLQEILEQLKKLGSFAKYNPDHTFYVVIAGGGYNGYSVEEMQGVYYNWCTTNPPPKNVLIKPLYEYRP